MKLCNSVSPLTSVTLQPCNSVTPSPEDIYQVVLFNDDSIAAEHVVQCLMTVFKHDLNMAMKIMFDAHNNGRSIAEVEGETEAKKHAQQLSSAKLTVQIEKV